MSEEQEKLENEILRKKSRELQELIRRKKRELFGERFEDASLASLANLSEENTKSISKWTKKRKNFLIYCGHTGIGKTHLCAALMDWIVPNFRCYRVWEERDIFKRLRSAMDEKGDYLECLKYLIDDDIVIVNDVGSEVVNDWREGIFFNIVDSRYNSMKPTIITSNFSVQDFKKAYEPRVSSRLFSAENTIIEILDGKDLRQHGF